MKWWFKKNLDLADPKTTKTRICKHFEDVCDRFLQDVVMNRIKTQMITDFENSFEGNPWFSQSAKDLVDTAAQMFNSVKITLEYNGTKIESPELKFFGEEIEETK